MKFTFEVTEEAVQPVVVQTMLMRGYLAFRAELEATQQKRRQIDDRSSIAVVLDRDLGAMEDRLLTEQKRWKDIIDSFGWEG